MQEDNQKNTGQSTQSKQRHSVSDMERKQKLKETASFKISKKIAKYWDQWYLDPIIGFIAPGAGDVISSLFAIPAFWMSAVKLRSVPLTLAIIYNVLIDAVIGIFPFILADIIDAANKANSKNLKLIEGFVDNDAIIIREVNRKAIMTGIMIVVLCVLIGVIMYFMTQLIAGMVYIISAITTGSA